MNASARLLMAGAVLAIAAPLPAFGQKLGGAAAPDISLVRILAALVVCIGAAIALALLLARRGLPLGVPGAAAWAAKLRARPRIAIVEARRISPHADVCLVRSGAREYLIVCGQGEIKLLAETAVETPATAATVVRDAA